MCLTCTNMESNSWPQFVILQTFFLDPRGTDPPKLARNTLNLYERSSPFIDNPSENQPNTIGSFDIKHWFIMVFINPG